METGHFHLLIHKHLDDVLSSVERAEVEHALLTSPQARGEFWRMAKQHAALKLWGECQQGSQLQQRTRAAHPAFWWAAFAVVAAVALLVFLRSMGSDPSADRGLAKSVRAEEANVAPVESRKQRSSPATAIDRPVVEIVPTVKQPTAVPKSPTDDKGVDPTPRARDTALAERESEAVRAAAAIVQARDDASQKRLLEAMSRVQPEGREFLALNQKSSNDSLPAAAPSPLFSGGSGPKPQLLPTTPMTREQNAASRTEIRSGSSFFDSKNGFGVFVDDVELNHPAFKLTADELEVYMVSQQTPKPPIGAAQRDSDRKVKKAFAKGRKVVILKSSADGRPQTGIGREAEYDGATGDIILRGWPRVQVGDDVSEAVEAGTYFVLKADGNYKAQGGRVRTNIVQGQEKAGGAKLAR
jgi:lipopolysaccharide export system protein LptA